MAITQRPNGTWQVQLVLGRNPRTGKIERRSWTFDTDKEARAFEARQKQKLEQLHEEHIRPSTQKLEEYLGEWIERKKADGTKPKTVFDYAFVIRRCITPSLGHTCLADLSPRMLQKWQDALAPTRDTPGATQAALAHRVLRAALSDAVRLGMLPSNPAQKARPALRSPRKREGYTLSEALAILASTESERLGPLIAFVLHSGLRHGEALALRWEDVDLEAGMVSIRRNRVGVGTRMVEGTPKTRRGTRTFALTTPALEALRTQQAAQARERLIAGDRWHEDGLVFATQWGTGLAQENVRRAFRRMRQTAAVRGLPIHSLRHATASILLASGVPVAVAAKMMGHSVALFCETYADLLVEGTRDAARQVDAFWASRGAVAAPRAQGSTPRRPPQKGAHEDRARVGPARGGRRRNDRSVER